MPSSSPVPKTLQHARTLRTAAGVHGQCEEAAFDSDDLDAFNRAVFKDQRWDNAKRHIRQVDLLRGPSDARALLMDGAQDFGIWSLSQKALETLIPYVFEQQEGQTSDEGGEVIGEGGETQVNSKNVDKMASISQGLRDWIEADVKAQAEMRHTAEASVSSGQSRPKETDMEVGGVSTVETRGATVKSTTSKLRSVSLFKRRGMTRAMPADAANDFTFVDHNALWWIKGMTLLIVSAVSLLYGYYCMEFKYKGVMEVFGWPVFVARVTAMGAAIFTGILYLTMARSFMGLSYRILPGGSPLYALLDGHKDLHIFIGKSMVVFAVLHVFGHAVGTLPGIAMNSPEMLDLFVGCANRDTTLKGWPSVSWFQWPACPFEKKLTGPQVWFATTPGLTGIFLLLLLLLVGYTGHKVRRSADFDTFWYVHNVAIVLWPILMFVHGSNQWLGVGFPIVAFTASVPICLYAMDRILRLVRYYCYARSTQIVGAKVRPGKDGGPDGAMTHLEISKPSGLWHFKPGMYAFICLPEYARLQWHPFTVASGANDEHVEFIVASVGDWTQHLAQRCLDACRSGADFPQVGLDGPYPAPTQSALSKEVLVAVGAGVGITPFLSLMSTIIGYFEFAGGTGQEVTMKEAHFYWMTRSADEFLFGRKHLARIAASPSLRKRVFLHLHTTAVEREGNAAGYLFREAVRRQSAIDRQAFEESFASQRHVAAPQLPWCWANGSKQDVLWLSHLTRQAEGLLPRRSQSAMPNWVGRFLPDEEDREVTAQPSGEQAAAVATGTAHAADDPEVLLPVAFGRPDFEVEFRAIGAHWPRHDVNVYVCGNSAVVRSLQKTCSGCNQEARRRASVLGGFPQQYLVTYERFG